ncbi:MAG: trimeric intracellular cation channel family protein [Caldilineaceae bacterium]
MSSSVSGFGSLLTLSAVAVFAVTGVLAGLREGSDIFSRVTFGVISAIGGGTIRDIILNANVFWVDDLIFIWVAIAASMLAFLVYRHVVHAPSWCSISTPSALRSSRYKQSIRSWDSCLRR